MTLTALGPISISLETLRGMLANSANVQAFLGVANSTLATARIYLASTPPPPSVSGGDGSGEYTPAQWENTLRPYILVYASPSGGYRTTRTAREAFSDRGKIFVEMETNVPMVTNGADANPEDADRTILNAIGQIINDLTSISAGPGNLDISDIALSLGPARERFEEVGGAGEYYWTLLEINWGPD